MATATAEYASPPPPTFSRSSSLSVARSPDTASPVYPERAIRPLPKSRLKSKLSPEQANSIVFPPDPPLISPSLNFSQPEALHIGSGVRGANGDELHNHYIHHHSHVYSEPEHNHCTCGQEDDSGDEEVEFDHPAYRYASSPYAPSGAINESQLPDGMQRRLQTKSTAPGSAASSADGYESFENTSNKKKRKIPLSSASSMHQSQLSADMASMGISGESLDGVSDGVHGGSGSGTAQQQFNNRIAAYGGVGISGAGRGRYGRQSGRGDHGIRRPLASSNTSVHGYNTRLPPKTSIEVKTSIDSGIENTHAGGIISQAIKSAAEHGPLTSQTANEGSSLLSSAAGAAPPGSSKTQFTFAMESESASKMMDQHTAAYGTAVPNSRAVHGAAAPGRANSTHMQGAPVAPNVHGAPQSHNNHPSARSPAPIPNNQQQPPAPAPKPRRRPSKEYALAARQRRLQQEYTNYHHRPTKDNMWICEFCEYEDIFGVPPVALIRQYEIKDRAERKRAAEKRRLLEKARAKGRKNKKGSKNSKNSNMHGNATAAAAPHHPGYDSNLPPDGEDYYDDEYDGDDYEPVGPDDHYAADYYPPPPPAATPQTMSMPAGVGGGGGSRAVS